MNLYLNCQCIKYGKRVDYDFCSCTRVTAIQRIILSGLNNRFSTVRSGITEMLRMFYGCYP